MSLYSVLELSLPGMLLAILLMVELGRLAGIRHRRPSRLATHMITEEANDIGTAWLRG